MENTRLLMAAQNLTKILSEWDRPNEDWRRLERSNNVNVKEPVSVLRWLAEQAIDAGLHDHAIDDAGALSSHFEETTIDIDRIRSFDFESNNNENDFDEILESIRSHARGALREAGTWACQHALRRADKAAGKINEQLEEAQGLLRQIRERKKEAEEATDAAKSAAAESGAAVFADDFNDSARAAKRDAVKWLWIAAGFGTFTVALAAYFAFAEARGDATAWMWLWRLPGRLFLLSILTYATVWCGRRSLAERHNSRVNLHRANSIRTIRAFRDSANAAPTKDALVLEAARAIFENVQTGDLGSSGSDGSPTARTIELVRPLGDATKD